MNVTDNWLFFLYGGFFMNVHALEYKGFYRLSLYTDESKSHNYIDIRVMNVIQEVAYPYTGKMIQLIHIIPKFYDFDMNL